VKDWEITIGSQRGRKPCLFANIFRSVLELVSLSVQRIQQHVFLQIKWPGYEGDHQLPLRAKVKNMWRQTPTLPYIFKITGCIVKEWECEIKTEDNFRTKY
jgi:hypothetical protein